MGSGQDARSDALRVGTAERERVAVDLRRHYADGRLTTAEFEQRTREAYAARTVGDLANLVRDLPGAGGRPARRNRPAAGDRPAFPRASDPTTWALALVVFLVLLPTVVILMLGVGPGTGAAIAGLRVLMFVLLAALAFRFLRSAR